MSTFGQHLLLDRDFFQHQKAKIPVQVYFKQQHIEIGFIKGVTQTHICIHDQWFDRNKYEFVSREGY